ncbi:hypothetical protein E4U21_000918 [Claviceps maximensis]|nr:hypothetical protein E4U21_000918 [Claviceps maximensis]
MVGISSLRSHKRPNYGSAHQDASSSSRTQKLGKCSGLRSHTGHGNYGGRTSDTTTGSSLRISNWRARQPDDTTVAGPSSSSSSTRSSWVHVENGSAKSASSSSSMSRYSSSARAGSVRGHFNKGKQVSSFCSSSDGADGPTDVHRATHTQSRALRHGSSSSSAFSFEVLRHSNLLQRDNGQTVSLFELNGSGQYSSSGSSKGKERCTLVPAPSEVYSADEAFVHMISKKHTVTPDDSERGQLLDALCASEVSPRRSPSPFLSNFVDALQRLTIEGGQATGPMDSTALRNSTMPSSSNTHQIASSSSATTTTTTATTQSANSSSHRAVGGPDEIARFNMFLDKLHGSVRQEQKPVSEGLGTSHHHQQRCGHDVGLGSSIQHRHPVHSIGRRVDTESDFMIEYGPASAGSSRVEHSADFGGTRGTSDGCIGCAVHNNNNNNKGHSLNPKAREFLSFSKADSAQEAFMARRPALSSCVFSSAINQDSLRSGTDNTLPALHANYLQPPAVLGQFPESEMKNPTPLNLVPIALETYNSSRAIVNDGTTKNLFPLVPAVSSIPAVASLPIPCGTGGLPVPPRPVPKPRTPDPKTQQEYEAWVEYRKSIEPGYALACKVRQQRRAQRQTVHQSK